jgi:DNA helicase-2/ATP-dependent DNA helicase PcrA
MKKLYLTYAKSRMKAGNVMYQRKSRFLDEIPIELVLYHSAKDEARKAKKKEDFEQSYNFTVGSVVFHEVFGIGRIVDLSGNGDKASAVVDFENFGRKLLLLKYANLKPVKF